MRQEGRKGNPVSFFNRHDWGVIVISLLDASFSSCCWKGVGGLCFSPRFLMPFCTTNWQQYGPNCSPRDTSIGDSISPNGSFAWPCSRWNLNQGLTAALTYVRRLAWSAASPAWNGQKDMPQPNCNTSPCHELWPTCSGCFPKSAGLLSRVQDCKSVFFCAKGTTYRTYSYLFS